MSGQPVLPPRANPFLFGQDAALSAFMDLWRRGRLAHGWLVTGLPGVGKATLTFRLARALLAGNAEAEAAQRPEHRIFRMVANDAHPDLKVLERQEAKSGRMRAEIVIDQVREVIDSMRSTAAMGGHRLLVVDPVDDLNRNAANALLKLLEEPPRGVVLLLVAQRIGHVPRTLVSRCAVLRLPPLPGPAMDEGLAMLAPDLQPDQAGIIRQLAAGSLGRAMELMRSDWLGDYARLVELLSAGDGVAGLFPLAELLQRRAQAHGIAGGLDPLATLLQRATRLAAGGQAGVPLVPGEEQGLAGLAAGGVDRLMASWDALHAQAGRIEGLNLDTLQSFLVLAQPLLAEGRGAPMAG